MKKHLQVIKSISTYVAIYYIFQLILMLAIIIIYEYKVGLPLYKVKPIIASKTYLTVGISSILSLGTYFTILSNKINLFNKFKIKGTRIYYSTIILLSVGWSLVCYSTSIFSIYLSDNTSIKILTPDKLFFENIIYTIIVAPFFEEILFRLIIIDELSKSSNLRNCIIIQAIIFAAFHGQKLQITYTFFFGIMLGLVYVLTKSIWLSIFTHSIYNLMVSLVIPIFIQRYTVYYKIIGLVGFIITVFSIYTVYKKIKIQQLL